MRYKLSIGDAKFDIEVGEILDGVAPVDVNGTTYQVSIDNYAEIAAGSGRQMRQTMPAAAPRTTDIAAAPAVDHATAVSAKAQPGAVVAPIPGLILKINVKAGDAVHAGQVVAILEAMKMENNIASNFSGTVAAIRAGEGAQVNTGDVIMTIE